MPAERWIQVEGVILRGHGVASGTGEDRRYPKGTLEMQRPFFAARGLDLSRFHEGTLNVDIAPLRFTLERPTYTFHRVEWTPLHPPEDFSFSRCRVIRRGMEFRGWIYTPHPETKAAHFQPPTLLEIIAPTLPGLTYGDRLSILVHPAEIRIEPALEGAD
jgi:hypothetical protein